jgi:hypothetical protein
VPEPIDAEFVSESRVRPVDPSAEKESAPLHVELFAWPEILRGRVVVTQKGKRREFHLDGSALSFLIGLLSKR